MLTGLNHITIAVSDLGCSLNFYINILGFKGHVQWEQGAYLSLGSLWLCLSLGEAKPNEDYSHIALSINPEDFELFSQRINSQQVKQWKINSSEGQSLYILDPDHHKLEVHIGDLASRLESLKSEPYKGLKWL